MGLDDLRKRKAYQVGQVKSRMEAENVEMPDDWWGEVIAAYHPQTLIWRIKGFSESQLRYFIEKLDKVIMDEIDGMKVTDEQISEAEDVREELLEHL